MAKTITKKKKHVREPVTIQAYKINKAFPIDKKTKGKEVKPFKTRKLKPGPLPGQKFDPKYVHPSLMKGQKPDTP